MILITGDIHLNDLSRDVYRHDWIANILPSLLRKHKAELLLILGDYTDSKDCHSSWLVNQLVDHLTALTEICPVICLKGNHDYVDPTIPFFEFLGKIPRLTWVNSPTHAENVAGAGVLGDALFLPHTNNYQRDWPEICIADLYLAHQTFQGAQVGPRKLDGIPTKIFPDDALVISGDIHVPQEFDQIVYCGSPYTCTFGDDFEPRVLLLDPVTLKLKSIPSPGPQKRLLEVAYPNRRIERPWTDYIRCKANPGDIIKVRVAIEAAQAPQWSTIKDEVKRWGEERGFIIHLVQPVIDSKGGGTTAKRKTVNRTDTELLELYGKSRAISETTLSTGRKLMEKA
jgi:hypothetical protein